MSDISINYSQNTGRLTFISDETFNLYEGEEAIEIWEDLQHKLHDKTYMRNKTDPATSRAISEPVPGICSET